MTLPLLRAAGQAPSRQPERGSLAGRYSVTEHSASPRDTRTHGPARRLLDAALRGMGFRGRLDERRRAGAMSGRDERHHD